MSYIGSKPANKPVVASDLDPTVITGQTALATSPADTDEFLISDAGVLKRLDASLVGGGGITEADQWRLTADFSSDGDITSNLERIDNNSYAKIGTGMSQSSGIFTFPSTGLYQVRFTMVGEIVADDNILGYIKTTQNNSSYANDALNYVSGDGGTSAASSSSTEYFFNVTNTSTHKVKFNVISIANGSLIYGNSGTNITFFTFIRLGDSQ